MKIQKKLLIFLLPLLVLGVLYLIGSGALADSKKSWLQISIYPLVLICTAHFFVSHLKVPKLVFVLAAALTLMGVGYSYMYPLKAKRGGLVIARLEGDELETETRIFREKINHALNANVSIKALSISDDFSNLEEAEAFISSNKKLQILISGTSKWVNIFFPDKKPKTLKELGLEVELSALSNLQVNYGVRTVGLSMEPSKATSTFIANLAEGVINYKDRSKSNDFELSLLEAARLHSTWSSYSHKGYALWFLANYYLEAAINSNASLKKPIFNCAVKTYKRAFKMLRKGDNPDLRASILNNLGVTIAARGYLLGKKKDVKKSKKYYKMALKIYKEKTKLSANYSAADVALNNLGLALSGKIKGAGKLKLSKKEAKIKKKKQKQKKRKKKC